MNCASCGSALPAGAAFCGGCGATVDRGVLRVTLDDLDTEPVAETSEAPIAPAYPPVAPAYQPPAPAYQAAAPAYPPPAPAYQGAAPAYAPAAAPPGPTAPIPPGPGYAYPAAPAPSRSNAGFIGAIIGIVGAAVVILGALLEWTDGGEQNAFKLAYSTLFDYQDGTATDAGVGVLLVSLAILGAVVSLVPKVGLIRNLCGVGVLIVAGLYLAQAAEFIDALSGFGSEADLGDLLGVGFYITAAGGLIMAAAPPRWR